jgi:hypothetical protein
MAGLQRSGAHMHLEWRTASGGARASVCHLIRECFVSKACRRKIHHVGAEELRTPRVLYLAQLLWAADTPASWYVWVRSPLSSLEVGKSFDALLVDVRNAEVFSEFDNDSLEDLVQKFVHLGDDRNIRAVWYVKLLRSSPHVMGSATQTVTCVGSATQT